MNRPTDDTGRTDSAEKAPHTLRLLRLLRAARRALPSWRDEPSLAAPRRRADRAAGS